MRKNLLRSVSSVTVGFVDSWTGGSDTGNYTVDLTGTTWQDGDLAIASVTTVDRDDHTLTGFTAIDDAGGSPGSPRNYTYYRVLQSGDTTFASVNMNVAVASIVVGIFRGLSAPTVTDNSSGSSGMPDPKIIGPVVTSDYVLCTGAMNDSATATAPSGYDLADANVHTYTTVNANAMMAYATGLSLTADPGAFGGGGSSAWGSVIMILSEA